MIDDEGGRMTYCYASTLSYSRADLMGFSQSQRQIISIREGTGPETAGGETSKRRTEAETTSEEDEAALTSNLVGAKSAYEPARERAGVTGDEAETKASDMTKEMSAYEPEPNEQTEEGTEEETDATGTGATEAMEAGKQPREAETEAAGETEATETTKPETAEAGETATGRATRGNRETTEATDTGAGVCFFTGLACLMVSREETRARLAAVACM